MSVQNLSLPDADGAVADDGVMTERASVRRCDTVSRQGGEEFVILRPTTAQAMDAALSCVR